MKRVLCMVLCVLIIAAFAFFALASSSEDNGQNQGNGVVDTPNKDNNNLGDYKVEILSCRLAKTYDNKPAIIVKYAFTNNDDEAKSFMFALKDNVFQNGIGLNKAYMMNDSANYSSDNQTKEIKTGATIEVEVAYELNDETTDIEVEVSKLISLDDAVVRKTFSIIG